MSTEIIVGLFTLAGVAVGFLLTEISQQWHRRQRARAALRVLWYQVADIELPVNMLLQGKMAPTGEDTRLSIDELPQQLVEMSELLTHEEATTFARILGGGPVMDVMYRRAISEARVDSYPDPQAEFRGWLEDLRRIGLAMSARLQLRWWHWITRPRAALRLHRTYWALVTDEQRRTREALAARRERQTKEGAHDE